MLTVDEAASSSGYVHPERYRATVRLGDRLLAETEYACWGERPGEEPFLAVPASDIRLDLLVREDAPDAASGESRWAIDADDPATSDGAALLRTFAEGPEGFPSLSEHGIFDHHRADVELLDPLPDGDRPGVAVKRFPIWGAARHLVDVLDVQPDGERRFVGEPRRLPGARVVEGSQLFGQAIVAASKHVPDRRVVSSHMVFLRAADPDDRLEFVIDEHANGRTMSTLGVRVVQRDKLRAVGTLLLDVGAPDVVRHEVEPPDTAGPEECEPFDTTVIGRDIRIVDDAYNNEPDAPVGPPVLDAWVRFAEGPEQPALHAALLAYYTGHMSVAAALRPHAGVGQSQAHRTLSTAINAIAISFHADPQVDQWSLYRHRSTFAGDGMTHSECRVHDRSGALLASFSVDAMVRGFAGGQDASRQERHTL